MCAKSLLPEQIEEVRQKYREGLSLRDLEDIYHVNYTTIGDYCKGIKVKKVSKQKLSDCRIKQIKAMHKLGRFNTEIARELGISKFTVSNYLKGA